MDESPAAVPILPDTESETAAPLPHVERLSRPFALLQVALIWVVPTQVLIGTLLAIGAGMPVLQGGNLSLEFFAMLSLLDTALVALLIRLFLSLSGETSRDVFIGPRQPAGEIVRGLVLVPVVSMAVTVIVLALRAVAPWTHTVEHNPLGEFVQSPLDAAIFGVVVVLAGGIREELQRAFILHRFGQRLWSMKLGLVLFSVFFGLMHINQGLDAAIGVGLLGVFWGVLYMTRRSAVLAMVNHAGFNAAQVLLLSLKTLGA
ncbi:MAG TPA: type II CAAX endopeptidase family protein [Vicinamibacterales bacterium]|nr:type II CAAX endopeptidase family protein [Vicinamibacterales bacterium]